MRSLPGRLRIVALVIAATCLLSSCSQGTAAGLRQPLESARAAVRTSLLSVQLMDGGRLTQAAALTALDDMGQELSDAAASVARVPTTDAAGRNQRAAALEAIGSATRVVLSVHDEVDAAGPDPSHERELGDADRVISEALARIGAAR